MEALAAAVLREYTESGVDPPSPERMGGWTEDPRAAGSILSASWAQAWGPGSGRGLCRR